MDILFENKHTRDREWSREIFRYFYFKKPMMVLFDVVFVLYFLYGIYSSIISKTIYWVIIITPIVWFLVVIFLYVRNRDVHFERNLEMHGKEIEVTVTVTDKTVSQSLSTGSEVHLDYSNIKKAVQTKDYIFLITKTNLLYSFKKDSFTVGNADDFLAFLKNKGVKVN